MPAFLLEVEVDILEEKTALQRDLEGITYPAHRDGGLISRGTEVGKLQLLGLDGVVGVLRDERSRLLVP